jgi:uncharacterized lipoprotein YbaY/heat shock protein HslJ/uncharacterized lipoprotein NlpE involved in copper resistance
MRRHVLLILACVLSSWSVAFAQQSTVSGTIAYRERIALPASATIEITIEDVSRADVSAVVVARERMTASRQVPMPFEVPYDTGLIDPSHRYAVRVRISDGDRLMFTTTETALVITQGHPSRVSLLLRAVGGASAAPPPRATAPPPLPPLPPAPEIRNLPATFAGTLPCADCPGIRYQLSLLPDDTFVLRMTYTGRAPSTTRDEVGSWVLSSDRRALAIKSADGPPEYFAIRDAGTLRKLDMNGQPMAAGRPYDLHRMPALAPVEFKGPVRGAYRAGPSGATFTPCATGRPWPVGQSATDAAVEAAYRTAGRRADEPLLLDVQGHLRPRAGADSTFVIDVLGTVAANVACDVRFGAPPLEGTSWRLVWLNGAAFPAPASPRNQPTLTFRGDTPTFAANGGCNRLAGRYDARGDTLTMSAAGTMMACPGADATETAFKSALAGTRAYRILGDMLELYGDRRQLLARFEAQKPQG